MKLNYFLRGLGVGITFATLILFVAYATSGKGKKTLTDEEIKTRAGQLGMVESNDLSHIFSSEVPTTEPLTETSGNADSLPPESETVLVAIRRNMQSNEVASMIRDLGLVESAGEFENFLIEHNYDSKIKIGDFQVPKNADYAQIAEIITGP